MASTPHPSSSKDWQQTLYAHPLAWLLLLACAHVVSRVLISPAMKWDESEQILWSQSLQLGYGPQPPLYTWIQWATCQVLGPSVLALAVVKHALIALTYCLAWLAARRLLGARGAWWAAAGLLLMLPFGWHSLRDQTHTVLVTAMAMGLWWAVLRQVQAPAPRNFVLIGLFCGLGMLSKYSYALLIVALFACAMTVPRVRQALFARGFWLAPCVGLLVFAPHAWWLLQHWGMATHETLEKMAISDQLSWLKGLGNLLVATLATLGLWGLAVLVGYRSLLWHESPPRQELEEQDRAWAKPLLSRYLLVIALALAGMVVLGDVTHFKQRWILPLTAIAPLALYVARPALLAPGAGRAYTGIAVLFALLFLVMATLRPWQSGWRGDPDELNHPVAELAAQLGEAGYDGRGLIVGADHMLAAMLHSRFPRTYALQCADLAKLDQCLAQAAATDLGQGTLFIARLDRADASWWSGLPPPVQRGQPVRSIALPFNKMRAGAAPAQYQYLWLAPATARP